MSKYTPETILNNPVMLKLDLFCRGLRVDTPLNNSDILKIFRTRAGLGSGIELIFNNRIRVNAPVNEKFAATSPYILKIQDGMAKIFSEETSSFSEVDVRIFAPPAFYSKRTSSGKEMSRIGVMQGSILSIYVGSVCEFWKNGSQNKCKFCTTGINVGRNEDIEKTEEDILEVIRESQRECGITFVHFNSGYNAIKEPYSFIKLIKRVRQETGLLTGVQFPPYRDVSVYREFLNAGTDHLSFCIEFGSPHVMKEICPGKFSDIGQDTYLNAIKYCTRIFPRGSISGEIIAGLEPVEETKKIIRTITGLKAFPTICVFRPLIGSVMEDKNPPSLEVMSDILGFAYTEMINNRIPVGLAPCIDVSIIVTPFESRTFADPSRTGKVRWSTYHLFNTIKQKIASFYIKTFRVK